MPYAEITPESMLVIGRAGSSSGRRQYRFRTAEAGERALLRWQKEGFFHFWTRLGDGELSKPFKLVDGERVYL
ncbi:hypothetical protein ABZ916_25845 [Streptomyces sp. NPDC046853]|uniref:hypothetical protein n=1 Tax=Streptomyces sp. NPDC046853 TaxID=3154920 RepID=UPI0033CBECDB